MTHCASKLYARCKDYIYLLQPWFLALWRTNCTTRTVARSMLSPRTRFLPLRLLPLSCATKWRRGNTGTMAGALRGAFKDEDVQSMKQPAVRLTGHLYWSPGREPIYRQGTGGMSD